MMGFFGPCSTGQSRQPWLKGAWEDLLAFQTIVFNSIQIFQKFIFPHAESWIVYPDSVKETNKPRSSFTIRNCNFSSDLVFFSWRPQKKKSQKLYDTWLILCTWFFVCLDFLSKLSSWIIEKRDHMCLIRVMKIFIPVMVPFILFFWLYFLSTRAIFSWLFCSYIFLFL
jgi:hypothetical protein